MENPAHECLTQGKVGSSSVKCLQQFLIPKNVSLQSQIYPLKDVRSTRGESREDKGLGNDCLP